MATELLEGTDFFEVIFTRTDEHEFVGVLRFAPQDGLVPVVQSATRVADLWRNLVGEPHDLEQKKGAL